MKHCYKSSRLFRTEPPELLRLVSMNALTTVNCLGLNWLKIRQLIKYDTAFQMYKVYNNDVPEQINELCTKSESTHHYPTRYASNNNFLVNFTKTEKGKRTILVAGAKV